jgi:hypothetical protein
MTFTGADPGIPVREGALKKIAPSGGRRENFWGISCEKSRFYAKKSYFFQFEWGGGTRAGCAPRWIRPCFSFYYLSYLSWKSKFIFFISFSDNPEALVNAVFLNNGAYFGLRGKQDHVNITWGDIQLKSTSGGQT